MTTIDDRPYSNMGCCNDRRARDSAAAEGRKTDGYRACDADTCMKLPEGMTCSDCVHERRCTSMFGAKPANTHCGFFPRRFAYRDPEYDTPVEAVRRRSTKVGSNATSPQQRAVDIQTLLSEIDKLQPLVRRDALQRRIRTTTATDRKTVEQRTMKLFEEGGELSRAVLRWCRAHGNNYRGRVREADILEEIADVHIVLYSIAAQLDLKEEDIDSWIMRKIQKWQETLKEPPEDQDV